MAGRSSSKETVYVSSTYEDLKGHLAALKTALERAQYDVACMEKYPAFDELPVDKCLADVAACDVYVLLVAHRYGYVPQDGNPLRQSITELEYEQARGRLKALRARVTTAHGAGFFTTPEDLASQVQSALQARQRPAVPPPALLGLRGERQADSPFPDGVVFLDLYALQAQPEMVWDWLASRLHGEAFLQRTQPRQRATEACRGRRVLVVIEGAEVADGQTPRADLPTLLSVLSPENRTLVLGSSWRWCSSNKATAKRPWTTPRLDCASPSGWRRWTRAMRRGARI